MKVDKRSSVTSSTSTYRSSKAGAAYAKAQKVSEPPKAKDSVDVSESANLRQTALEALKKVPDVRPEAIEGIQKEFDRGAYHRDETEVAEKVIQDYLTSP